MVFSSPVFLFFFLPIFLIGYYLLFSPIKLSSNKTLKRIFLSASNIFILAFSLLFYFWGEAWLVLVMLTSTVIDYSCGLAIARTSCPKYRKRFLSLSIVGNLSLLAFFKYFNFGIDNFNIFVEAVGFSHFQLNNFMNIALPLGISFYTFQSMSYTIDIYRRVVEPTRNFLNFACFVTMFPQLVAGPIVRYRDVAKQIIERTVTRELFVSGSLRFILGLGKKVLVANTLAVPADKIFALSSGDLSTPVAWLGIFCYSLQIYFDFSGYSDMAIGLGRMLGFQFPENFNYPYYAQSIQDFWRRWHISLSTWFRDYIYIPLGGGRCSTKRTYANLVIVFLLCGLWHGAAWPFIIWGLYHGGFLVLERLGLADWLKRLPASLQHLYVISVVMMGWVLFRADSLDHSLFYYASLMGGGTTTTTWNFWYYLLPNTYYALIIGSIFSWPVLSFLQQHRVWLQRRLPDYLVPPFRLAYAGVKVTVLLAVGLAALMSIANGSYNPFIYFRF